jgi:hypothetical protein
MHFDGDKAWIVEQLELLSKQHQIKARAAYSDIFYNTHRNELIEHKKNNAARREANIRLRNFVDKCLTEYKKQQQSQANNFSW